MTGRAWPCNTCGALVQPEERSCHRCGNLRDAEPEELPPVGTPAEFVAMVHRTAVGPTPPPRGPLPDTLPAATELAAKQRSNTVPGVPVPVVVPEVRVIEAPQSEPPPTQSRGWLWFLLIPIVLGGGGYLAYWQIDAFRDYVDGMVDAARG